jgi:hypothetical protein
MTTDQGQIPGDPYAAVNPPAGYTPPPGAVEPPPPAPKRGNAPAILSIVLFFLPVIGLVLSIIGLVRAGRRGRRAAAIIGLILAILVNLFTAFSIVAVNLTNLNTASDPGCRAVHTTLTNTTAERDDPATFKAGLQDTIDGLTAAAAKADHANVNAAILTMRDDYTGLLNDVNTGTQPSQSETDKASHDADQLDALCTLRWK